MRRYWAWGAAALVAGGLFAAKKPGDDTSNPAYKEVSGVNLAADKSSKPANARTARARPPRTSKTLRPQVVVSRRIATMNQHWPVKPTTATASSAASRTNTGFVPM